MRNGWRACEREKEAWGVRLGRSAGDLKKILAQKQQTVHNTQKVVYSEHSIVICSIHLNSQYLYNMLTMKSPVVMSMTFVSSAFKISLKQRPISRLFTRDTAQISAKNIYIYIYFKKKIITNISSLLRAFALLVLPSPAIISSHFCVKMKYNDMLRHADWIYFIAQDWCHFFHWVSRVW